MITNLHFCLFPNVDWLYNSVFSLNHIPLSCSIAWLTLGFTYHAQQRSVESKYSPMREYACLVPNHINDSVSVGFLASEGTSLQCLWQQVGVWHPWGFPPRSLWQVCSDVALQGKALFTHYSKIYSRETKGMSRQRPAITVITYTSLFHPW